MGGKGALVEHGAQANTNPQVNTMTMNKLNERLLLSLIFCKVYIVTIKVVRRRRARYAWSTIRTYARQC